MRHRLTRLMAMAGAGAIALTAVACGGGTTTAATTSASATPLRIFEEVPSSVPALQANSAMAANSAKAAVAVINKAGGVLGHPIQLTIVDDGGSATTAVTKLEAAINSGNKPAVFLQGDEATTAAALLPILTQNKIASFNQAPTATSGEPATNPYNFDLSPSTSNYASAFCPYVKAHGGSSVAILHGNDAYGNPLAQAMAASCAADGVKVTGTQQFDVTALDVTPQLEALQAGHPDYLLLQAYGAPAGYVLQDIQKLGWNVPILGDDSVGVSAVVNQPAPTGFLGTSLEKNLKIQTFACTVYKPAAQQPAALNTMLSSLKAQGPIDTTLILAYMYDAVVLAADGAEAAGTTTNGAAIAAAVAKLKPGGPATAIFPSYHFSSTSHAPNVPVSSLAFVVPTKVVDGQFGAPGS